MTSRRTLPTYGGVDAGPRPDARDQVRYELTEDTPVAACTATLANPQVTNPPSAGGLPQYYIPDWQARIKSGAMTKVNEIPLGPMTGATDSGSGEVPCAGETEQRFG